MECGRSLVSGGEGRRGRRHTIRRALLLKVVVPCQCELVLLLELALPVHMTRAWRLLTRGRSCHYEMQRRGMK